MTITMVAPPTPLEAPPGAATADASAARRPVHDGLPPATRSDTRSAMLLPATMLTLIAVLMMGFVAHVAIVSHLQYQRTQQLAYADFRAELAKATAPVGQTTGGGVPHGLGTPVAVLLIPSLDITDVVFEGTTSGVLQSGPGHRRDTALPGQAGTSVIMGRRAAYGAPLRDLDLLNSGDTITLITGQGEHRYTVLGPRRAGDIAPPPLAKGAGRLTLMTADGQPYLPSDVLRVDADLTSEVKPSPTRPISAASLPAAERPMATDPGAWVLLVLWGQALMLTAFAVVWLSIRWGRWQAWIVGAPVLTAFGLATADQVARLLPNLL